MGLTHIHQLKDLLQMIGMNGAKHPLFFISKVETINHLSLNFPVDFSFGFYTIGLIRNMKGSIQCGRRSYDYQKGTLFFLSPDQLVGHAINAMEDANGWLLFFHRSFLANHHLEKEIDHYGFFDYVVNEALHLSDKEEHTIEQLLVNVFDEYHNAIDDYSHRVVISNLELILSYANRYYGRQFITRNEMESTFLVDFDHLLNAYFKSTNFENEGIPSVSIFAEQLNTSAKYLGDKLRVLTGKTAQEHINLKLIEKAKVLLLQRKLSVSQVAYQMGFEYPQYFSRFFKKRVGVSPKAFQDLT